MLQPQPTTMPPTRTPPRPRSRPTRATPDGAAGGAVGGRLFAWFVRPTGPLKDAVQGCLNWVLKTPGYTERNAVCAALRLDARAWQQQGGLH